MICDKCKKTIEENTSFCPYCGIPLKKSWWRKIPGFRTKTWWKMLLAAFCYFWILMLLLASFSPDSPKDNEKVSKPTNQPSAVAKDTIDNTTGNKVQQNDVAKQLNIKVTPTNEMDSKDNNKVVTMIENKSPYIVSGNVHIKLLDAAKNIVSSDTIFFENINAGSFTNATSWLKAKRITSVEWEVIVKDAKNPVTTDASVFQAITNLPVDESTTTAMRSHMKNNFGGAYGGKPTSWYGIIDTITVYQEGGKRIAVVKTNIAKGENKSEALDRVQGAVMSFAASTNNKGLAIIRVDVFDVEGNRIASRANPRM